MANNDTKLRCVAKKNTPEKLFWENLGDRANIIKNHLEVVTLCSRKSVILGDITPLYSGVEGEGWGVCGVYMYNYTKCLPPSLEREKYY